MKSLFLGWDANGRPVRIPPEIRRQTHTHVIGSSGTGKSKFLEHMIRQDIHEGQGLCVVDWHGTLYQNILEWCAFHDVGLLGDSRRIILLDPSRPDFVTGFNPFTRVGEDVAPQVNRRITATIKPWGQSDTNDMPTFERVCRLVYTFAVERKETLPNAAHLLDFERRELRESARESAVNSRIRAHWRWLQNVTTTREWNDIVLSTDNRLTRFLTSNTIKRFMGLTEGNIDLMEAMERGYIVLVNLADTDFLSREEARLFAALFLNQFFETAMRRAGQLGPGEDAEPPFVLYLDEFQEYINDDLAAMLDQVRKGGLHMVLAHQHLGHFVDNPRIQKSVFTNARIRAVFGGLDYADAALLANEMFLPDLNTRQIKKAYYHTIHLYEEQTRTIHGHSSGRGSAHMGGAVLSAGESVPMAAVEGWFVDPQGTRFSGESTTEADSETAVETDSEVEVPVFVPIPVQELGSETEWTREEKVSKVVEMLKTQQQRHCFVKIDTEPTQPLKVPLVRRHAVARATMLEYKEHAYSEQGARPGAEVDRLIAESETRFLAIGMPPDDADEIFAGAEVKIIEHKTPPAVKVPKRKKPTLKKHE